MISRSYQSNSQRTNDAPNSEQTSGSYQSTSQRTNEAPEFNIASGSYQSNDRDAGVSIFFMKNENPSLL
jgi:hypothetical protein